MKVKTAHSEKKDIETLVSDIQNQIGTFDTRFLLFFASPEIDPNTISTEIQESFPNVPTMGCSSSGEIISGKMLDQSIVAMAFGPEIISDCKIEILPELNTDNNQVDSAMESFGNYFNTPASELSPKEYVGMMLIDGVSLQEETVNDRVGDLTNVTFVGGSAGDDMAFKETYVYANGNTYTDAAALVLIKSNTEFDFLKTQSFESTGKDVTITKADESNRKVLEINNKPAVEGYSKLTGIPKNNLSRAFFTSPVGLVSKEDMFVRSPQRTEGEDIYFYCSIKEGMNLKLLESGDIVEYTKRDLNRKIEEKGYPSAIINFNCILRTLELKDKNQTEDYGNIFTEIPTVGFSTYGESFIGHMNQTATMLLFR